MRKFFVVVCLFFCITALHAGAIQEDFKKAEEKARISYAFGVVIGSYYGLKDVGIDFDYNAFTEGLRAAMEDSIEAQFTEQEAMEIIEASLQGAKEKIAAENKLNEEKFLAENRQRPEIYVTPSGLQYEILKEATGEKPSEDSVVRVYYAGGFRDGSPLDSVLDGEGELIPLKMVFPGLQEGIKLMSVGSQYRFYIPSELAYGNDDDYVMPYSTLIVTIELLEITEDLYENYWE